MTILPGESGCLRCLMPEIPEPGSLPTCDTAGVLSPIVHVVASIQAQEALKLLSGKRESISSFLTVIDLWNSTIRQIDLAHLKTPHCPTCGHREFPWLTGRSGSNAMSLCGRNSVQLTHGAAATPLEEVAQSLAGLGHVIQNDFLVRLSVDDYELTIFRDGRAIVHGTSDLSVARAVYARYIGT